MADLQQYTKASVYIDSAQLTEESSVSVKHMSGAKEVNTVAKGLAGFSPGSPRIEIQVKNAVPAAGFEYVPFAKIRDLQVVEISIFAATKTLTTKGVITESNFSHAVDNESTLDFTAICQYAEFE